MAAEWASGFNFFLRPFFRKQLVPLVNMAEGRKPNLSPLEVNEPAQLNCEV